MARYLLGCGNNFQIRKMGDLEADEIAVGRFNNYLRQAPTIQMVGYVFIGFIY